MPLARPKLVCKRTTTERKAQRHGIRLEEASLTENTRERYSSALMMLVPVLLKVTLLSQLDAAISDWVEAMWSSGQPQYLVSDALSGLSFYEPWTKRQYPNAWRLFSVWRKLEIPSRAPPFTAELIRSLATYAYRHNDLLFAAVFLLGFYGMLRTGEILNLTTADLLVNSSHIIVSLQNTKTGKRKGCQEVIHIDDIFTIEIISAVLDLRESQGLKNYPLRPYSSTLFRKRFNFYCWKFGLRSFAFRPYSLRRRGRDASFSGYSQHGIHIGHGPLGERQSRSNLHKWCFILFTWNGLFFTNPPHACSISRPCLIVLRTRRGCVESALVLICFSNCMNCWKAARPCFLPQDGESCMGLPEDNGPEFPALGNTLSWNLKSYRLWQ